MKDQVLRQIVNLVRMFGSVAMLAVAIYRFDKSDPVSCALLAVAAALIVNTCGPTRFES